VPDSVICCSQIQEDNASFQLLLKTVLDVGVKVTSAKGFPETSLTQVYRY